MTRWGLAAGLALASWTAGSGQAPAPVARFHHVQVRVDDPAAAMDVYAKAHGCTKTILQGLGVGVRCGSTYVLFDRRTDPLDHPIVHGRVTVTGSGDSAVVRVEVAVTDPAGVEAWLHQYLGVDPGGALTFAPAATGASLPDEIAHVGFGLSDPAPLVARLAAAGIRTLAHGQESTTFAGPSGLAIEIAHDAGLGPDAYWCAMHPDVRSPTPGKCPICGMALIPIPPPVFGDDRLDVAYKQTSPNHGRLTLRVVDPKTGKLLTSFVPVHERLFHLFVVSADLEFFEHVHPQEQADGSLTLDLALPHPGMYVLYGDFYPTGGTPQLLQSALITPDDRGSPFPLANAPAVDTSPTKLIGGQRVTMTGEPLTAGNDSRVTFVVADGRTGAPVTDLEPYVGAPAHLLMVSADLVDVEHSHPTDFATKGPNLTFVLRPPHAGVYKIWIQFQRAGQVITAPFVVSVK